LLIAFELSSNTFCKSCADSDICSACAAGAALAALETLFANLMPLSKAFTMPFTGAAKSSISSASAKGSAGIAALIGGYLYWSLISSEVLRS
jgi:hypothetical protein